MSDTPRLLTVKSSSRTAVAIEEETSALTVYVSQDADDYGGLRKFAVHYNTWDGELYRILQIDSDLATIEVLATGESRQVDREQVEPDWERIIPMEQL